MKIFVYQRLESVFTFLAEVFEELRQSVAVCPDCGRSRYKGAPCVGGN